MIPDLNWWVHQELNCDRHAEMNWSGCLGTCLSWKVKIVTLRNHVPWQIQLQCHLILIWKGFQGHNFWQIKAGYFDYFQLGGWAIRKKTRICWLSDVNYRIQHSTLVKALNQFVIYCNMSWQRYIYRFVLPVFKVLQHWLLRYILYTCPNLW